MKIEKLPSGSYRIRKTYKGKTYTVVVDYKPTQKEAIELINDRLKDIDTKKPKKNFTFQEAYDDYVEINSNVLSPSTIRGYKIIMNAITEEFKATRLSDIDSDMIQKFVNDYTVKHSPKTVKNVYGLISTIMKKYVQDIKLEIHLPQPVKKIPKIPTDDEVSKIMAEIKGTPYYIPTALAMFGLRKSEIVAINVKTDLGDDNSLTINKAIVTDENGNLVQKGTKTTDSTRVIYLPDELANMIRNQGYVYNGFPDNITRNLKRVQDRLGIEHFPLHKMRHFFVSYAHNELKLSDEQILTAGGWKTSSPQVMKQVYLHSMKDDDARKMIADNMKKLF